MKSPSHDEDRGHINPLKPDEVKEALPVGSSASTLGRRLTELVPPLADALIATGTSHVYREALAFVERALLAHALRLTRGNQLRAARLLGLNRNTLHKRGRELGVLPAPAPHLSPATQS